MLIIIKIWRGKEHYHLFNRYLLGLCVDQEQSTSAQNHWSSLSLSLLVYGVDKNGVAYYLGYHIRGDECWQTANTWMWTDLPSLYCGVPWGLAGQPFGTSRFIHPHLINVAAGGHHIFSFHPRSNSGLHTVPLTQSVFKALTSIIPDQLTRGVLYRSPSTKKYDEPPFRCLGRALFVETCI